MSLNAHDRQALARIEEELQSADPQFAARLSAFCGSADGEAMPEREVIRGLRPGQLRARTLIYAIAIAMAVSITLALVFAVLVMGHGSTKGGCAEWQFGTCARQATPSAPAPSGHTVGKGVTTNPFG